MAEDFDKEAGIISAAKGGADKAYRALSTAIKNRAEAPKNIGDMIGKGDDYGKAHWAGQHHQHHNAGESGSVFAYPFHLLADKVIGKDKVRDFLWKNVQAPALKADMAIGHKLSKLPLGKKLFRIKENVPHGVKAPSDKTHLLQTDERPSALGPLIKSRDLAEPIMVGIGTERAINAVKQMKADQKKHNSKGPKAMDHSGLHEKVASVLVQLRDECRGYEKRAHATRLLWKEVEMGLAQPPGTFDEYEQKIASLVNEDLTVLERALEMSSSRHSLGTVTGLPMGSGTAEQNFMNAFLDNDF